MKQIHKTLRTATQQAHQQLEATALAQSMLQTPIKVNDYINMLESLYCFWCRAEKKLMEIKSAFHPLFTSKTQLIQQDLARLYPLSDLHQQTASSIPQLDRALANEATISIMTEQHLAPALLYLHLGSEFGNHVIARHLQQLADPWLLSASRYYQHQSLNFKNKWQNLFTLIANQLHQHKLNLPELIDTINHLFKQLHYCFTWHEEALYV